MAKPWIEASRGALLRQFAVIQENIDIDWKNAVEVTTPEVKQEARKQARDAFPDSRRAPTMWQSRIFPNNDTYLGAVGSVYPAKAANFILAGLIKGGVKRARKGPTMAVPTPAVKRARTGVRGKRLTPKNWPENRFGALQYVPSNPPVLVATQATVQGGRLRPAARPFTRKKKGAVRRFGVRTKKPSRVVAFTLLPVVRAVRAFRLARILDKQRRRTLRIFIRGRINNRNRGR